MLRLRDISDVKTKGIMRSVGTMIYLSREDEAKETIKKAKNDGRLILDGYRADEF